MKNNSATLYNSMVLNQSIGWIGFICIFLFNLGYIGIYIYDLIYGCRTTNEEMISGARK